MLAKVAIANGVRRAKWEAKVEQVGKTASGVIWVADVMAVREGKKSVAFEIQWSRQTEYETRMRQSLYASADVRGMWLFRQHDFSSDKDVPAFHLRFDESSNTFDVRLPSRHYHPSMSRRESNNPELWLQSVELSTFVEGALTGRLHYAPALNRTIPMVISAAPTCCWKCRRESKIITHMTFAVGNVLPKCSNISVPIYDFKETGYGTDLLISMLPASLLRRYGIGPIKLRGELTAGGSRLANRCIHCGIPYSDGAVLKFIYDAVPILSFEVFFNEAWASQLGHAASEIYHWWFDEAR